MMNALQIIDALVAVGVPEPQAKAHARVITESVEETAAATVEKAEKERDNLATKGDIAAVKSDISEMEARLHARIAEMRADLVKWIVIVNGITAGLLIAAAAVIFSN